MTANTDVNVSPAPDRQWVNSDGLRVQFGSKEADLGKSGEFPILGPSRVSEFDIDYTVMALGTDGTHCVVFDYNTVFPAGAILERCDFVVGTAWAGASMTLNFGLIQRSDFTTIIDTDGLMDSFPTTVIDLAGNVVTTQPPGSYPDITTYVGALLGTALAADAIVVGYWEVAVPTAGTGKLRITWRPSTA